MGLLTSLLDTSVADPLTTVDLVDDFLSGVASDGQLGALGWRYSGGATVGVSGVAGHPGIVNRDTSTTINTIAWTRLQMATGAPLMLASEFFDVTWVFRLNVNDSNVKVRLGVSSDWSNDAPASAVYVEKQAADTSWFGTARASSTESRTAALATVDTGWHKARVRRIDASTVGFSFDGGSEATLATNVPGAVAVAAGVHITNTAAASKTLDLDLFHLRVTGLGR